MSKILVTGSMGYIGKKIAKALKDLGHDVIEFDRNIPDNIKLEDVGKVDMIFHFAAQTNIKYSITNPYEDAMDNVALTDKIIQTFPDTRIFYPATASSIKIDSPYALSKKTAVESIKLLVKDYVIITLPNIWGDGGKGAIDVWMKSEVINIFGDGKSRRTIVHVDDVVKAFIKALDWKTGEYSLGGQDLDLNEIAQKIGKPIVYHNDFKGLIFSQVIPNTTPDWTPEIKL